MPTTLAEKHHTMDEGISHPDGLFLLVHLNSHIRVFTQHTSSSTF